ncbi:GNAT family N-acetyltransferase [Poseidonocella pacifica]|nr:GNAT family N-acetyltransferase [Poseidonocella pacifica]
MSLDEVSRQAVIETERFDLRPLRRSDEGRITLYASDERVARMTSSIPHPFPPGAAEAFITRSLDPERAEEVWAIDGTRVGESELMGVISLKLMDRAQCEIGYWVAPAYWNTGLASEAVQALLAANPMRCQTIFASVFQDNAASARVLTNAGFSYIGDAETYCVARDTTVPTWTYSRRLG